jgi:hypothetical protein
MKKIELLILIAILTVTACKSDEPNIVDNKLVGQYISTGGSLGLASGDSLIVTNQQISWLDSDIAFDDNGFAGFSYNKPWVTVSYTIVSDSTLIIDPPLLWSGSGISDYIYRIASDTVPSDCSFPENSLYLDAGDCTKYSETCCIFHWIKL